MNIEHFGQGSRTLCIVTGIHGNEASLFAPLRSFCSSQDFPIKVKLILANVPAAEVGSRYINQDLNRSFQGNRKNKNGNENSNKNSNKNDGCYEFSLARELLKEVQSDPVLDFHTHSGEETFCLAPRKNINALRQFISALPVSRCILLSETVSHQKSLIENIDHGISIETGRHHSAEASKFAQKCVQEAIAFISGKKNTSLENTFQEPTYLLAKTFLYNKEKRTVFPKVKNFQPVRKGEVIYEHYTADQDFIPVLVSERVEQGKKVLLLCEGMNHENI